MSDPHDMVADRNHLAAQFEIAPPLDGGDEMELRPPFLHDRGYCWMAGTGPFGEGDSPDGTHCSPVILYEDGRAMGTPHSGHDDIRQMGSGRFSHWQNWFWFSPSDNSDPNTNGRRYSARVGWDQFFSHHARLATTLIRQYLANLDRAGETLAGKTVVEIGPSGGGGTLYALAALGARVIGLDPFPQPWRPDWHPPYMRVLAGTLSASGVPMDEDSLLSLDDSRVSQHRTPLDTPPETLAGQADIVLSTAVLEHVSDPAAAVTALAKISRPGALGIHIVDFRDHRDNKRPLEFLLLDDDAFEDANRDYYRYVTGSRITMPKLLALLEQAGFQVIWFDTLVANDPGYIDDVLARLPASPSSFKGIDRAELVIGIGVFIVKRVA
jgi:hypothetical protein